MVGYLSSKIKKICPTDQSAMVCVQQTRRITYSNNVSKQVAEDFYQSVHDKAFIIHDTELGNVEIYFLQSKDYDSHKRKRNDQEQHYFNEWENQQIKNLEAAMEEKDQQIKNLEKDIEKDQQIKSSEENEKILTLGQFHELVVIVFYDNANKNDLDFNNLKNEIKRLKLKDNLLYYEKECVKVISFT
uniref:Uncharacterized protein n=3 Tax=Rhizophagus irregularis TaxID=588596 RepID=U9UJS2_RHIID